MSSRRHDGFLTIGLPRSLLLNIRWRLRLSETAPLVSNEAPLAHLLTFFLSSCVTHTLCSPAPVSYTHLTLPTIYSV